MDVLTDTNRQTVIRLPQHSTRVQRSSRSFRQTHTKRTGVTVSPRGFNIAFEQLGQKKEASHRYSDRKRRGILPKKRHTQSTTNATWEIN